MTPTYFRSDLLWESGSQIHAAEGDRMVDQSPSTFLVWTLCGLDVPGGTSYTGDHSDATCSACLAAIRQLGSR